VHERPVHLFLAPTQEVSASEKELPLGGLYSSLVLSLTPEEPQDPGAVWWNLGPAEGQRAGVCISVVERLVHEALGFIPSLSSPNQNNLPKLQVIKKSDVTLLPLGACFWLEVPSSVAVLILGLPQALVSFQIRSLVFAQPEPPSCYLHCPCS
jgi:hypothetical protein